MRSTVSFTYSSDGTRIAWSRAGQGRPLVRAGMFMTHIEHEATNQVWGHWTRDLSKRCTYVRYDERGCGLSERDPTSIGEEVWLEDLDAVVGSSGFERVALFGMSQGAALAIAYAAAHPERVSHLVLLGGYAAGGMAAGQPEIRTERTRAMAEMMRLHWSSPTPNFRRAFTMNLLPDGSIEEMNSIDEMQRVSCSGEMAGRILLARDVMDVRRAAASLDVPTLVAHARDDQVIEYANGIELAATIPGATLLTLDSGNHLLLREPAWDEFVAAVSDFLGGDTSAAAPSLPVPQLSDRELEVLECVAHGSSNEEIAVELHLSVRTIERHLTNLYAKLGLSGKSARAGAVARLDELRRVRGEW